MDGGRSKYSRRRKMCNKILVENLKRRSYLARLRVYCILIMKCGVSKYGEDERTRFM
jgi:hypothetical protein